MRQAVDGVFTADPLDVLEPGVGGRGAHASRVLGRVVNIRVVRVSGCLAGVDGQQRRNQTQHR